MGVFYSGGVVRGREVGSMDLYGKALARQQLYQRVGGVEQVAGIQPFVFDDGPARGVRALRLRTGGSLSLDVLCDRGMDLGAAEYWGVPLAWVSPTGAVAPHFRELQGRVGSGRSEEGCSSRAGSRTSASRLRGVGRSSGCTAGSPTHPPRSSRARSGGKGRTASSKRAQKCAKARCSEQTWSLRARSPLASASPACGSRTPFATRVTARSP